MSGSETPSFEEQGTAIPTQVPMSTVCRQLEAFVLSIGQSHLLFKSTRSYWLYAQRPCNVAFISAYCKDELTKGAPGNTEG